MYEEKKYLDTGKLHFTLLSLEPASLCSTHLPSSGALVTRYGPSPSLKQRICTYLFAFTTKVQAVQPSK